MKQPAIAARLRRKRMAASWKRLRPFVSGVTTGVWAISVMANPRIEQAVENVDQEIENDDEDGNEDNCAHHQRVVTVDGAKDEVATDARDGEDRLNDGRAGKKGRSTGREIGHDRQHRTTHRMGNDDRSRW